MVSEDALDRLLDAIGDLSQKVDVASKDTRLTNDSIRTLRKEQASVVQRMDEHAASDAEFHADMKAQAETAARNLRRHDSGFRQTSEVDAKHASELAALVIAVEDGRKLAKKCLEQVDEIKRAQVVNAAETAAQTPVLAKVDSQTKQMSTPTKAAAVLNFAIGLVYLISKIFEWAMHR